MRAWHRRSLQRVRRPRQTIVHGVVFITIAQQFTKTSINFSCKVAKRRRRFDQITLKRTFSGDEDIRGLFGRLAGSFRLPRVREGARLKSETGFRKASMIRGDRESRIHKPAQREPSALPASRSAAPSPRLHPSVKSSGQRKDSPLNAKLMVP